MEKAYFPREPSCLFCGFTLFGKILEKRWCIFLLYFALTIKVSEGSAFARSKISSLEMNGYIKDGSEGLDFTWSVSIAGGLAICLGLILCSFGQRSSKMHGKGDGGCVIRPPEACGETSTHTVYTTQSPIMSAMPAPTNHTKTQEDVFEPVQKLHEKPQELLLPDLQPAHLEPDSPIINLQNQENPSDAAFSFPYVVQPLINTQRKGSMQDGQVPPYSLPPVVPTFPTAPPAPVLTSSTPQESKEEPSSLSNNG